MPTVLNGLERGLVTIEGNGRHRWNNRGSTEMGVTVLKGF